MGRDYYGGGWIGVKCVTIGANKNYAGFVNESFRNFYESQGRKAGTYIFTGRLWRVGTAAEAEQMRNEIESKYTQAPQPVQQKEPEPTFKMIPK